MRQAFLLFVERLSKLLSKVYVPNYSKKSTKEKYRTLLEIQIGLQTGEFKAGDLILSKTRGYLSNLFLGKWTHAAILIDEESVIEAVTDGGVKETPLIPFLMGKDNICVLRPKVRYNEDTIIDQARRYKGLDYDWTFSDGNKIYCSELYRLALRNPDWLPTIPRFGSNTLAPTDLYKNENLKVLLEVI